MVSLFRTRSVVAGLLAGCLLVLLALNGCTQLVIGAGALTGVAASYAAYSEGIVVETYDADYHQMLAASCETLTALDMPVSAMVDYDFETVITAQTSDETPVSIRVVRLAADRIQLGVRTGPIGVTERDASTWIHQQIRDQLARLRKAPPVEDQAVMISVKAESNALRRKPAPAGLTIRFDADSNELRQGERPKIDRVVTALTAKPKAKITLNGYTDVSGPPDYNRILSEGRASAVKMYMVGKGVNARRIRVIGRGASDFVAANTADERHLNRRVEIAFDK